LILTSVIIFVLVKGPISTESEDIWNEYNKFCALISGQLSEIIPINTIKKTKAFFFKYIPPQVD